jgi:hypothetical protein
MATQSNARQRTWVLDSRNRLLILQTQGSVTSSSTYRSSTYRVDGLGERRLDRVAGGLTEDLFGRVVRARSDLPCDFYQTYLVRLRLMFVFVVLHRIEYLARKVSYGFRRLGAGEMEMHRRVNEDPDLTMSLKRWLGVPGREWKGVCRGVLGIAFMGLV